MASLSLKICASGASDSNTSPHKLPRQSSREFSRQPSQPSRDPRFYSEPAPELSLYRPYTMALLRRYMAMSSQTGRLPSILGQEFFRSRVLGRGVKSFEDVVILVHDVDRALAELPTFSQQLIARVILQEFSFHEAARLLRCSRVTVARELPMALDRLSQVLLERDLLEVG